MRLLLVLSLLVAVFGAAAFSGLTTAFAATFTGLADFSGFAGLAAGRALRATLAAVDGVRVTAVFALAAGVAFLVTMLACLDYASLRCPGPMAGGSRNLLVHPGRLKTVTAVAPTPAPGQSPEHRSRHASVRACGCTSPVAKRAARPQRIQSRPAPPIEA